METENNLTILSAMTNIIVAARRNNESSEDAEFFSYDDELMNNLSFMAIRGQGKPKLYINWRRRQVAI